MPADLLRRDLTGTLGGMVASNDIEVDGQISIVPASDIETRWGATYVGWSPPYFPAGG